MRVPVVVSSCFISFNLLFQETTFSQATDSVAETSVDGKILIANVGFAPIPAFSFEHPVAIGTLSVRKKKFSYEPDFALGLNGRPWLVNNWFRVTLSGNGKTKFNVGVNPALFFKMDKMSGEEIIHVQRNVSFELAGDYQVSEKCIFTIAYRYNKACDVGALSGHFVDSNISISGISISDMTFVNLKTQLFYFNFTGPVDGLFAASNVRIGNKKIPVSIYGQVVLPLWTNLSAVNFKWNAGFVYDF